MSIACPIELVTLLTTPVGDTYLRDELPKRTFRWISTANVLRETSGCGLIIGQQTVQGTVNLGLVAVRPKPIAGKAQTETQLTTSMLVELQTTLTESAKHLQEFATVHERLVCLLANGYHFASVPEDVTKPDGATTIGLYDIHSETIHLSSIIIPFVSAGDYGKVLEPAKTAQGKQRFYNFRDAVMNLPLHPTGSPRFFTLAQQLADRENFRRAMQEHYLFDDTAPTSGDIFAGIAGQTAKPLPDPQPIPALADTLQPRQIPVHPPTTNQSTSS